MTLPSIPLKLLAFVKRKWILEIVSVILSVSVFALILINRSPNVLRPLSLYARTGFNIPLVLFLVVLYLSFRLPGRTARIISLSLTLALFALALAGLWAIGQTQSSVLNGIVPLFDSAMYYTDSLRLISGQDFSVFSARRPLFSGLLSVILALTDHNLMMALAIFTLISALACYYAAREIQSTHGVEVAVFVLIILFLFYRHHSGSALSENLGLPLGTLGFAVLWRGVARREIALFCLGLFVFTLALNARAGTFFMLPLLLVWGGWVFRQAGSKFSWKYLGIGSTAVVLGFVANLVIVRLLSTPSGVPFANFSYSLYGLASGGKSWTYVFETHPELNALPEPFQSQTIYRMAFELIASNPMLAIKGALYNWSMLFSNSWYSAYSFIGGENQLVQDIAQWVVYLLCILGLVRWSRNRDDSLNGLVVVATIGVLISVPFLPPTDAYRMRPYAASIIVFGLLPAMGLLFAIENLKLRFPGGPNAQPIGRDMLLPYTALLVVVTLIGPSIVKNLGHMPEFKPASCDDGLDSVSIRFDPGTHFNLVRESEPILDWMPNFHIGRFRRNAHSLPDSAMIAWAADLKPTTSLFVTLDYLSMKNVLIVAPTNLLPEPGTLWTACGKWETKPVWEGSNIFTVQTNAHAP